MSSTSSVLVAERPRIQATMNRLGVRIDCHPGFVQSDLDAIATEVGLASTDYDFGITEDGVEYCTTYPIHWCGSEDGRAYEQALRRLDEVRRAHSGPLHLLTYSERITATVTEQGHFLYCRQGWDLVEWVTIVSKAYGPDGLGASIYSGRMPNGADWYANYPVGL